ncbi:hypothetical protein [Bythopirellula polymerisocia]|uniref:Uncharacterized protein n=1 Tax=Bythopirellula polymerisocia TaxID=2528003 RepID=A0A5C6CVL6_9BACT|nr:hypothetical protein [Bythopirellula polymerisocia]TWU27491.1 hypothetical protein Pla144_22650 [Bythopirellula polymerisocia]
MDRATVYEDELPEDDRTSKGGSRPLSKWKKRRGFTRKNRRPSRPTTHIGQRNNHRLRQLG